MHEPNDNNTPFAHALQSVLREEGGYVNNPADPGGETNFGISKRYHPTIDIRALTADQAGLIYKTGYWDPLGFSAISYEPIAIHLFHVAVLHGPTTMLETAKMTLTLLWTPPRGRTPNRITTEIACKLNGAAMAHRIHLTETINYLWSAHILTTIQKHPERTCFQAGWNGRINRVFKEVTQLWTLT